HPAARGEAARDSRPPPLRRLRRPSRRCRPAGFAPSRTLETRARPAPRRSETPPPERAPRPPPDARSRQRAGSAEAPDQRDEDDPLALLLRKIGLAPADDA